MKSTVTHTTVAAQPGWFLAVFDSTNDVRYEQIIAWEIERTTSPRGLVGRFPIPITVSNNNTDLVLNDWAIKRPDGKFVLLGGMSEAKLSKFLLLTEIESATEKSHVASPGIANGDPIPVHSVG